MPQVVFFYAQELMNDDYTELKKIKSACTRHFSTRAEATEECLRLVGPFAPTKLESPKFLLLTFLKFLTFPEVVNRWGQTVKAIFLVRDPADYLWAAFNYWRIDMDTEPDEFRTTNTSYRSPELFHGLLLAEGRLSWMLGTSGRTAQWWFLVQNGTLQKIAKNRLLLRSEDFLVPDLTMLAMGKLGTFTGLRLGGFDSSALSTRTNSQYSIFTRGQGAVVEQADVPDGVYEISGFRPMLCKSRRLIYQKSRGLCQVLATSDSIERVFLSGDTEKTHSIYHIPFSFSDQRRKNMWKKLTTLLLGHDCPVRIQHHLHGLPVQWDNMWRREQTDWSGTDAHHGPNLQSV